MRYNILRDKVYAMIPARSGSKGVPDQNIRLLGGKPLIAWSIEAALNAKLIDRTIVSTDSEKYAEIARQYGAETPFLRPAALAGDKSTDTECFEHFLNWFQEHEGGVPEYVVHLRPTTPLRDPKKIDCAISMIKNLPAAQCLLSVQEMQETAYKCFEKTSDGRLKPMGSNTTDTDIANLPRQMFPMTYTGNGYVDIIRTSAYEQTGKFHGEYSYPFETEKVDEIDSLDDFLRIEAGIVSKNNKQRAE